jgi:hypothetical protein
MLFVDEARNLLSKRASRAFGVALFVKVYGSGVIAPLLRIALVMPQQAQLSFERRSKVLR